MKKLFPLLIFLAAITCVSAQKTLVLEKIGTSTRYAFHLGDDVKIRTIKENVIVKSYLWHLTDTSVTIGPRTIIQLPNIGAVYKNYHFPKLMSKALLIAGAGYFVLDSFNNLINNEQVFVPETMLISGCVMAAGVAIIPFWQKKIKIGIRWKLKIMDINLY